jgi:hypothetical protein
MLKFLFIAVLCLPLTAMAQSAGKGKATSYGEQITAKKAIPYEQLLKQMQGQEKIEVKVRGTVENVCQAKGCWMNLVSENGSAEKMMVQFKDYGFFMPKDIAGREVIVDGYAYYEVTPVDELRHYAEDAGKSPEEIALINEPLKKLKFMAHGVLLMEKGK